MASLKKVLSKKKYQPIALRQIATNHLELDATINGVSGKFILDTGASNSCVGTHLISHFNLLVEPSETKAAGAGAIDMETQKSTDNTLQIGRWHTEACHLVVFDLSHVNTALTQHHATEVQGIIGADILEQGKAVIDYAKKTLYLKKTKKSKKSKLIKLPTTLPF